jgi:hypothetical protein
LYWPWERLIYIRQSPLTPQYLTTEKILATGLAILVAVSVVLSAQLCEAIAAGDAIQTETMGDDLGFPSPSNLARLIDSRQRRPAQQFLSVVKMTRISALGCLGIYDTTWLVLVLATRFLGRVYR